MDIIFGIIIFFVLLYYLIKLFFRYVVPWLLRRYVKKQQEKFGQNAWNENKPREGEVKIKRTARTKQKDDVGFGEYIDFEDVDDNDKQKK
ncbi:MAG: DUF4834 domain-containing protein [Chlorobi bacterium]|nr:DUF4834 domain-containing protein [Chlorobiota bacterium]